VKAYFVMTMLLVVVVLLLLLAGVVGAMSFVAIRLRLCCCWANPL